MSHLPRLAIWLAALASTSALAQAEAPEAPVRQDEAAESVRRVEVETGGDVLRAERMQRGGREVFRLKVLTPEGRVRVMQDDPRSRSERALSELRAGGRVPPDPRVYRDRAIPESPRSTEPASQRNADEHPQY